jgi:hypothetical protein
MRLTFAVTGLLAIANAAVIDTSLATRYILPPTLAGRGVANQHIAIMKPWH